MVTSNEPLPEDAELLTGRDRILIRDLLVRGILGLNAWEQEQPQDILVNLELYVDLRRAGATDDPGATLDYRAVTKDIIRYVESAKHFLVEALATAIARLCVVDHGADRVVVRVEKPGALRFARSVGVQIERCRADFEAGDCLEHPVER